MYIGYLRTVDECKHWVSKLRAAAMESETHVAEASGKAC